MLFQNYDVLLYQKTESPTTSRYDILGKLTGGFSPSAGAVVIAQPRSAIFVDGRYTLAAQNCIDKNKFEIAEFKKSAIINWIKENILAGSTIAYDAAFFSIEELEFFTANLNEYRFLAIDLKQELAPPYSSAQLKLINVPTDNSIDKFDFIYKAIEENELDAYLVSDTCSVAWLLDFRNLNEKFTPVFVGHLLITKSHEIFLYTDDICPINLATKTLSALLKDISVFAKVGADKNQTPATINCNNLVHVNNPCALPQSIKNDVEVENIKVVAKKDSVALINFLHWFHNCETPIFELDAVEKVHYFRAQQDGFIGESFATIAAADENAAVVHYAPSIESNKIIKNVLLLDSGGQYKYGTTDITRTIALHSPTLKEKLYYTLVLKGHIAIANAKFPKGTTGAQLDSFARQFLWQYNADYGHSTGHGIGYMLHVHEGPVGISKSSNVPLQSNMLLSNEPGYYLANNFGIRLENMMIVQNASKNFLKFDTISLVPFDVKFIDFSLLTRPELNWLRTYHKKILTELDLEPNVRNWVRHQIAE
ncbi:MAG: M24 family metallopeptidase [Alphaproteobacteria bacterium]|nr:M24 family metallopeptidase [Alphaproteobacteria bacterium]